VLIDPDFKPNIPALLNALPGFAARIDFLSLDPLEHKSLIAQLQTGESEQYATNMQISLNGSFDRYWQDRSKNLRKNISRYENRLERENKTLEFRQITVANDILSAVDRYGMLESQGWKGKLGTALHPSNQQGQFYRDFLYQLALQHNAVVYEYYLEEKIVASRLCCIKQNMLIILKTTFDEDYKNFALGRLLLKQILQVLFSSSKVEIIDFYTNASQEQLDWSTDSRPIYNSSYYSNTLHGKAFQLASWLKQKFKMKPVVATE
jgi:CelD/BcsL family acetyltransferase involved in cellulose biosynthesis